MSSILHLMSIIEAIPLSIVCCLIYKVCGLHKLIPNYLTINSYVEW